ncbi:MAG: RNA 2',3'-cyclic phosphodiesterase [Christensenellaceae bacterium]|jgi:2'-5' RNA ligase|nr:RNA 2',3'-cyclic phosphodiesterase [Christensenellaceae bacterium]
MRLFIAIELPKPFCAEVLRLQREVKRLSAGGRFVPEESFHITLHFIGESEDLQGAVHAMQEAVRGIRPFTLHLGKCDSFQKDDSCTPYVDVLGELGELQALYESLQSALYDQGFSRENRRFTPHITLGRSVALPEGAAALEGLRPNASMMVQQIVLFESARQNGRVLYIAVHRERFA